MSQPSFNLRLLVLAISLTIGACSSLPALAGATCQLLDANGVDIGDGGADAGPDDGSGSNNSIACGRGAQAPRAASTAFGNESSAGLGAMAMGYRATASGNFSTAIGIYARTAANKYGAIAIGSYSTTTEEYAIAIGWSAWATGQNSISAGSLARADGDDSAAFGYGSVAAATNAVALGANSVAGEANTVSLGHAASDLNSSNGVFGSELKRRMIHLAAGIDDTDAVNLAQLYPLTTALGGGAGYAGGVFNAPSYFIQGISYDNVGAALAAVDTSLSALQAGSNGVAYDSPAQDSVTLAGATGTRISNLADGVADTDAANLGQVRDGDAATLVSANAHADAGDGATLASANARADAGDAKTLGDAQEYADAGDAATLSAANAYTDQRFTELTSLSDNFAAYKGEVDDRFNRMDRRIDKMAAMSGAYAGMAMNTAGLAGKNRVGVGIGTQGGEQAMAVGYQRVIGNRASVSLGAAFGGNEKSVSAGAGFSW